MGLSGRRYGPPGRQQLFINGAIEKMLKYEGIIAEVEKNFAAEKANSCGSNERT